MDCDMIAVVELLEQPNVSHRVGIYEDDDNHYETGSLVVVKIEDKVSLGYVCNLLEVDEVNDSKDVVPGMVGLVHMDAWKMRQKKKNTNSEGSNFQNLFTQLLEANILNPLLGIKSSDTPIVEKKNPSYSIHISILPMEGGYDS